LLAKDPTVVRERLDSVTSVVVPRPGKRSGVCRSISTLTMTKTWLSNGDKANSMELVVSVLAALSVTEVEMATISEVCLIPFGMAGRSSMV